MAENLQQFIDTLKEQLRRERAENARLRGLACLICGRDTPCELDTNKDNDPSWPGSPCTFDPSPVDAARRFMEQRDALQARVEEADPHYRCPANAACGQFGNEKCLAPKGRQ